MEDYEAELFKIYPWLMEVMQATKELNNGLFMRGRSGWKIRGVQDPESCYEHSCKVGLAAHYLLGTREAVSIGVSHDFPEIIELDYIPGEISKIEKQKREYVAMEQLRGLLPDGDFWHVSWEGFELRKGVGNYIFELDKICPVIQAINYSRHNNGRDMDEFYPYARNEIKTPELIDLLDSLRECSAEDAYDEYFEGLRRINIS